MKIAVLNQSTVVTNAQVQQAVTALVTQVARDFAQVWGVQAQINFHPSGVAPRDAWQLVILDNSDQANALGYHELTVGGLPLGKVFAASDLQAGTSWTVTASHELLEMLIDPEINLVAESDAADGSMTFYAYEVCDAVEADNLGYSIGGVLVSDWVFPAWFQPSTPGPYSFRKNVTAPFQLAAGGYIAYVQTGNINQWTQKTARGERGPYPPPGSRRERRTIPDALWRRSTR